MTITLTFLDGTTVRIEYVAEIALVAPHYLQTRTFGNAFVSQRNVASFAVEPFVFPPP